MGYKLIKEWTDAFVASTSSDPSSTDSAFITSTSNEDNFILTIAAKLDESSDSDSN